MPIDLDGQVSAPPDYPEYPDDPDFLDRSSPDFVLRMRGMTSAVLIGVGFWAGLIYAIRRLLGR